MDGGSTDGTLELLSAYPHLQVTSTPDRGIYDALNKGVAMSKGEIIGHLNTDDYYQPNIFKKVMDLFDANPDVDAVCGSARIFESDDENRERDAALRDPVANSDFASRVTVGDPIFNAWFFRRRVFERIGQYSLDYPLMADRDFLVRCCLDNLHVLPVNSVFYHYRRHAGSLTINYDDSTSLLKEVLKLSESYLVRKSLNPEIKKNYMKLHDNMSIEMLIWGARNRNTAEMFSAVRNAIIINPFWLFVFVMQIPGRIINYVKKHYGA
jgi:glycosyltransferase involved in cell wall biosynthesis